MLGDVDCLGDCASEYQENLEKCPCQSGCPNGCPCPNYQCDVAPPEHKSEVLVLNTYKPEHIPILTNANGRVDRNFFFLYGEKTEVFQSCGLTWRNQFYLFGGTNEKRQVSKLSSCKLERVGELDFDLDKGGCANLNDEKIYLCFGLEQNTKKCRYATDPLEKFSLIEQTSHSHSNTRIAASKSK